MIPAWIISCLKSLMSHNSKEMNTWNVKGKHTITVLSGRGAYIHNLRERWMERIRLLLDPKRDFWSVFSTKVLMHVRQLQWRLAKAKGLSRWMASVRMPAFCLESNLHTGGWCEPVPSKKTSLLDSRGWVAVLWLPTEFSRWTGELDSSRGPGATGNLELKFK